MRDLLAQAILLCLIAACPLPPAWSQRFADDPVEKLRAVLTEDYKTASKVLARIDPRPSPAAIDSALRQYRDKLYSAINGNKATGERGLGRSSSVLSRALLLKEWRGLGDSPVDAINNAARADLLAKFVSAVNETLKSSQPALQIAQCNLISETLANYETQEDSDFEAVLRQTADNLLELTKRSADAEVRIAGAKALSRFFTRSATAAESWKHLLRPSQPDAVRRAAAESLENMLLVTAGVDRLEASQPGVATRPRLANKLTLRPEDKSLMVTELLPVAALAAVDKDVAVRLAGVRSVREAAGLLDALLKQESNRIKDLAGKRLTMADLEALQPTLQILQGINKSIKQFALIRDTLLTEFNEPDPRNRTEARRAVALIAQMRAEATEVERLLREIDRENDGLLQKLYRKIKRGVKEVLNESAKQLRPDKSRPEGTLRLIGSPDAATAPTMIAAAPPVGGSGQAAAGGDKRDDLPPPGSSAFLDELQGLDTTLKALARGLSDLSGSERNLAARRATAQTLESLGELAHPYREAIARQLGDPDLFVRWIAARTLGKMGEKAASAVPGLASLCHEEEDQDVRIVALDALGKIGPPAVAALPAVTRCLTRGDAEVRLAAIDALEGIGQGSEPALATLVELFQYEDYRVRAAAAKLVGRFESKARRYVPQLRKLVDDRDATVRGAASAAILAIGE